MHPLTLTSLVLPAYAVNELTTTIKHAVLCFLSLVKITTRYILYFCIASNEGENSFNYRAKTFDKW